MNGWEIKKLGDIYDVRDGTHDSPKYQSEGYALITSKNLKSNGLSFNNIKYISESDYKKINKRSAVHKGDILLAMIGTIGNPIVVEVEPEFAIKNVALIKVPGNQNSYFLKYYLETEYVQSKMQREAKGTTQKFVGLGYLRDFPIALPPSLSEQKRIVAILDEAFERIDRAIANTEKNLTNTRKLFKNYLSDTFTRKNNDWKKKKLEEICTIKHGFAFKGEFFVSEKSKYILLTPGSFYESGGYRNQEGKTKYYIGEIPSGYILKEGDLLFAMTEQAVGLLGSSLIVPKSDIFLHNQRLGLVQVFNDFEWYNKFFFHQFNTKSFRASVQSSASGVKVRHTSPKKLGSISICFPPTFFEQKIIADALDKLYSETQRLETIYRKKLTALNELKQSILQKAFTGELTADTANHAIETAEEDRPIRKDCLRNAEAIKQNVHQSGQLSLWA